ncbi:endonuclease III [Desulfovibrio sp. OttesenSCG-928-F07]|nr:endonuclease III [Desulfovibrio sp. OttesenSCG-928-F07]
MALAVLQGLYSQNGPHLHYTTPWELLVATVLAAQCTDARVNMVTPALFKRLPSPAHFAAVPQAELEELIRSTGFYHNKAKHLIAAAKKVVNNFNGQVPDNMQDLTSLDGVARKTANVVLNSAFGKNEGLAVDTHVGRISYRLGLTKSTNAVIIERDLLPLFPQAEWGNVNHYMVSFGREVCKAQSPRCIAGGSLPPCPMQTFCPQKGVGAKKSAAKSTALKAKAKSKGRG